jgi:hypothetical protein
VPAPVTTAPDIAARVALIQVLVPVALDKVMEELQADVERLAGARYARAGRLPGHVRWTVSAARCIWPTRSSRSRSRGPATSPWGSVPLPTDERVQQPRTGDAGLLQKVLGGVDARV